MSAATEQHQATGSYSINEWVSRPGVASYASRANAERAVTSWQTDWLPIRADGIVYVPRDDGRWAVVVINPQGATFDALTFNSQFCVYGRVQD